MVNERMEEACRLHIVFWQSVELVQEALFFPTGEGLADSSISNARGSCRLAEKTKSTVRIL